MKRNRGLYNMNICLATLLITTLLFTGVSSATDTILFQSASTTSWNYFASFFSLCGNGGWSKVSSNTSIKVLAQDTNTYSTGGKSYIQISVSRINNILFSDGMLGFALPEDLDIYYENIKILFVESSGSVYNVTSSFNPCTQSIQDFLKDQGLGSLPFGIGTAYSALFGLTNVAKQCSDGNQPFYGTSFLNRNGWDQSLLQWDEPGTPDDYSGKEVRLVIPITNKTRSELLTLFSTKPLAIHGNVKANSKDNLGCSSTGTIVFTKEIYYK